MEINIEKFEFVPLYDRVLVERVEAQVETPGGLYIPDSAKEKPSIGYVVSAGHGRLREDGGVTPLCVKPGDKVLFGKYAGTDVKVNNTEFLMMREEDILGIIR
jgi:chaperonin GroES